MNKKNIFIALLVVVVGFSATLFSRTDLFQGYFRLHNVTAVPNLFFNFNGVLVSPVVTPVSTVIVSDLPSTVTSQVPSDVVSSGGTSEVVSEVPSTVTSQVPSALTTAVASAVALNKRDASKIDPKKVKKMTARTLEKFALMDYKKNPKKYSLTWKEKDELIKLYERNEVKLKEMKLKEMKLKK